MPSYTSRHYTPHRWQTFSKSDDDIMEDMARAPPATKRTASGSLALGPSDGSLLDYFDLPSPPSTPHRPTHGLSFSSLNSLSSPPPSPRLRTRSPSDIDSAAASPPLPSLSSSPTLTPSQPAASPPSATLPRWPTLSQRISRLPTRPRSRSAGSSSLPGLPPSSSSSSSPPPPPPPPTAMYSSDVEMTGTDTTTTASTTTRANDSRYCYSRESGRNMDAHLPHPTVRHARRTPYYPPNASRTADRSRVYMNRGPHYLPNWTPLGSLPRHVQLQIEEKMVQFTAL